MILGAKPAVFVSPGQLILASGSPRRREMLRLLGLDFIVRVSEVDERVRPAERPAAFVKRVGREKAMAVAGSNAGAWILAADTAVVINGQILGKPANAAEALVMLKKLAGGSHEVWTGFCLIKQQENIRLCRAVRTVVRFVDWHEDIFSAYVNSGDSLDKAGGYGIQGAGGVLVRGISGSYSNVVGLPMAEVMAAMLRLGAVCPEAANPSLPGNASPDSQDRHRG
ncbi:MAG: septum formation protein Maf [Deltaproteobacteria bacterium]|nr:septum formation protein Maf [Deltaproteobacteria bacterium]